MNKISIFTNSKSGAIIQRVMEEITHFASALRSTEEEILKKHDIVASQKFFNDIFGAIPGIGAIIDKNRQIVYSNDDFLKFLGINSLESILGKRP